jgi:hypothetical protein
MRIEKRYLHTLFVALPIATSLFAASTALANTTYGGRGCAVHVRLLPLILPPVRLSDTGALPAAGGSLSANLLIAQVGLTTLSSHTLSAGTVGGAGQTNSFAYQEAASVLVGIPTLLTASVIRSDAQADCSGASGSSVITDLRVLGNPVVVTGAPNQTISIVGIATLIINEQILDATGTGITVNAVHLNLLTGEEVILSSAQAAVSCLLDVQPSAWSAVKSLYSAQ